MGGCNPHTTHYLGTLALPGRQRLLEVPKADRKANQA